MTEAPREPFEQLERCHRRLEENLEALAWSAREAKGAAADVDALRDVAGYFARAMRRHEEDEEGSLFPRLKGNLALADKPEIEALLVELAAEHHAHLALHAQLDALITTLDATPDDATAIAALAALSDALTKAYRSHVDAEERTLFPAARAALDAAAIEAMGREMQERRAASGGGGGGRGRGGGGGGGGGGGRGRVG
jgi:hemerythrin-like domain-containing protein